MPIDAVHLEAPDALAELEVPAAAALEVPALLLLLLFELPQPAATSAVSAVATSVTRTFMALAPPLEWVLIALVGGGAVRIERGGRRSRGPEHGDDAHWPGARVGQAMHRPGGQLDARARPHRAREGAGLHRPLALEHVDHLVVGV